jgi:hypothetical protein
MVLTDRQALVDSLRAEAGDALRVIAVYDREGYAPVYVRDDVSERMTKRADAVHDELVLQGIGRGHLEDLFAAGELECSMHRFEELTAFHFAAGEFTGLFVSLDHDADVSLVSFAEGCERYLPDEGTEPGRGETSPPTE